VIQITDESQSFCKAEFTRYVEESTAHFTDKSTGEITDYIWSFDDGSYAYTASPSHTYSEPGFYEVCQTVYDENSDCMDEYCKIIQVFDQAGTLCKADFSYYTEQKEVKFKNNSEGTYTDYFWDFGDGAYSYKEETTHEYLEQGYYEVMLIVYDANNSCVDEQYKVVSVIDTTSEESICNARFRTYNREDTIFFEPKALGDYKSIFWDFGDGYNSNEANPYHVYAEPGYYDVYLTIMDSTIGCYDSRYKEVYVEGSQKPGVLSARYSYFVDSLSMGVDFKDESFGNPTTWYWDFGDNSAPSTQQNPDYTYSEPGYYKVCLTIGDGSLNQKTRCKYIAVGDVSADLVPYFTYYADKVTSTGHFKNESRGDVDQYLWDFGDGVTSEQKHPSHTYADTGVYAVCLTVTNSTSGVSESYCRKVRIGNAIDNPCVFSCVWPGDANKDLEANHYDIMTIGLNFGMQGPARKNISTEWMGHYAQDWATYQFSGVNNKHGDCNGDGVIDWDDTTAINKNFAHSHYEQPGDKSKGDWIVSFEWSDSKPVGRRQGKVQLGPPAKGSKSGIYGLGYEIEVVGGSSLINFDQTSINFGSSWMGTSGSDLITFFRKDPDKNKFYFGLARNDGQNVSSEGTIAEIDFAINDMKGITADDASKISLKISSLGGIKADGSSTQIDGDLLIELGSDIQLCEGESATIQAPGGMDSYNWSTGASSSGISVSESGTYSVTVTDSYGSTGTDKIKVTVHDKPTIELGDAIEATEDTTLDAGAGFANYSWSTGESTQSITVNESGNYKVTVTNTYGCSASDNIDVTINTASDADDDSDDSDETGLNDQYELSELLIYPNPAKDVFYIKIESTQKAEMYIKLIDQNGHEFYNQKLGNINSYKNFINVSDLARGVYYLQVIQDNRLVGTEKIVIH
jgi:PKD repeat protein